MNIEEIIDFLETDKLSISFSSKGLKYLSLKDNDGDKTVDLKEFNKDKDPDPIVYMLVKETINFLETGNHNMVLDLGDLTDFQRRVLKAVSKINVEDIYTYGELAQVIGKPGAARAVGNAIAKNPVSYFIPTHRVVPQRGIGDCKSGAGHLKEKLLIHEGHDIDRLRKGL